MITLTYVLLALAICAVWLPAIHLPQHRQLPAWQIVGTAATICALVAGVIRPPALIGLGAFVCFAWLGARDKASQWQRSVFGLLTIASALALAMHRLPGFNNPVLLAGVKFATDSAPFTLYANFDKGLVGLVLLAWFCPRSASLPEFGGVLRRSAPVILATLAAVFVLALTIHFVRIDFKFPEQTAMFLAVNLFFAVVAEEAFFRGLIQERLSRAVGSARWKDIATVIVSALLFGLVHLAGGTKYAVFAFLAGVGYATTYQMTRRIEGTILAHFVLNAAQFCLLSYPYLQ
jgi:membrane protease YdiL (CAAX protease family)